LCWLLELGNGRTIRPTAEHDPGGLLARRGQGFLVEAALLGLLRGGSSVMLNGIAIFFSPLSWLRGGRSDLAPPLEIRQVADVDLVSRSLIPA
jgi:hypothetical protein